MPMQPFRILTTCSWEQNAYTVKIYVPLHGVKTDLLRAVFQPHTLDIKAVNLQVGARSCSELAFGVLNWSSLCHSNIPHQMVLHATGYISATNCSYAPLYLTSHLCNMQGKNYIFSIKQTYRPVNPDGCSVIASKTKKNILITILVRAQCLHCTFVNSWSSFCLQCMVCIAYTVK